MAKVLQYMKKELFSATENLSAAALWLLQLAIRAVKGQSR
jgi:hypothetical protein